MKLKELVVVFNILLLPSTFNGDTGTLKKLSDFFTRGDLDTYREVRIESPPIGVENELAIKGIPIAKETKFLKTIDFIKFHEGYSKYPKNDINGYPTIGYGFIIKYVPKHLKDSVTKEQGHNHIIDILKGHIKYAKKAYPGYKDNQYLAIAHLAYRKGFGRIQKHKLHGMLKANNIEDSIWLYFSSYERERTNFLDNTKYELNMFNDTSKYELKIKKK